MFSRRRRRITSVRFPHSGIHGSKAIQRLTVAYRSRSRPSSTLGAKASTMCPYYLDGDRTLSARARAGTRCWFGDTRRRRAYRHGDAAPPRLRTRTAHGYCAVFKGRREAPRGSRGPVSQNSTACSARAGRDVRRAGQARSTFQAARPVASHRCARRVEGDRADGRRRAVRAPIRGSLERR